MEISSEIKIRTDLILSPPCHVQVQTTPFLSAEAKGFPSPLHEQHRTGTLCSFRVLTISALDTDQRYTDPSAEPEAT